MVPKKLIKPFSILLFVLGLFALQIQLNHYLRLNAPVGIEEISEQRVNRTKTDPRFYRIFSVGHLPVVVDWIWLLCLVDPVMTRVPAGIHPPLYYQFELLTRLDPIFYSAYDAGATLLGIIRKDIPGAVELLHRADEFRKNGLPGYPERFRRLYWPNPWKVPLMLAYFELFELQNVPRASEYFIETSQIPGAPQYLSNLAARLQKPDGQIEVGFKLLNILLSTTTDESSRAELAKKRNALGVALFLRKLNRTFAEFLGKRKLTPLTASRYWDEFRNQPSIPKRDPLGGTLVLNEEGKIDSTTLRESVFGIAAHD